MSDFRNLQSDVDSLVQWISDHDLKLNVKRCKLLLLSRKWVPTCTQTVVVDGQSLDIRNVVAPRQVGGYQDPKILIGLHFFCSRAKKHMGMLYGCFYHDADF